MVFHLMHASFYWVVLVFNHLDIQDVAQKYNLEGSLHRLQNYNTYNTPKCVHVCRATNGERQMSKQDPVHHNYLYTALGWVC